MTCQCSIKLYVQDNYIVLRLLKLKWKDKSHFMWLSEVITVHMGSNPPRLSPGFKHLMHITDCNKREGNILGQG